MSRIEIAFLLLVSIVILAISTRRLKIPYPIGFVIGGLVLSLLPRLPPLVLEPKLVFLFFVPPILFYAAYHTSWRDFRANLQAISMLAFGLVIASAFIVATLFHFIFPDLPWSVGWVLGAIISPPDAVAATAITNRLKVPRRITHILEGESLINDASGLILYKFAVAAVATGHFSLIEASWNLCYSVVGGVLIGWLLGWLTVLVIRRIEDIPVSITVSIMTPFAVFIIAEKFELSGVLAVVVAGLVFGWYAPKSITPQRRIKGAAVWETFLFLINGIVFLLIGLQLPVTMQGLSDWTNVGLVFLSILIVLITVVVRFIWVFGTSYGLRLVQRIWKPNVQFPPWRNILIIAWTGMRGIVSLGAAMALPLWMVNDKPFPARDLIIFLTFATIIGTLVFQGLTLPFLIRWLGLKDDDGVAKEERFAREEIAQTMLQEVERLANESKISSRVSDMVRRDCLLYSLATADDLETGDIDVDAKELGDLRRKLIHIGRSMLLELRHRGKISDEVMHAIQAELDLDEVRIK